jgi:hypothetical protein
MVIHVRTCQYYTQIRDAKSVMYMMRGTKGFAKLPGRKCDPLGKEMPDAMLRWNDWKTEQILKYPNADWVSIGEPTPTLCATSPMAIEFLLKHSFDTVSKFGARQDREYIDIHIHSNHHERDDKQTLYLCHVALLLKHWNCATTLSI